MSGRTHELTGDKTTIGRVEDNSFQLAEPSVSSHHCEVFMRGNDVVVKDLNSTNGTFINGEKVTESVLQPGQTLRLGQIELRLDIPGAPPPPPPAKTAPAAAAAKKTDHSLTATRGVSLSDLEQGTRTTGFDTAGKGFSKKQDKANKVIWIVAGSVGFVILVLLMYVFLIAAK
jgi:pSer/pThr/pTyr-binding forkhead associated (FHA) protein